MVYIFTMEYNSILKRKKILTHAILWRSPGDIILSKVNQLHDHTCCLIPVTLSTLCSQTDGDTKEHGGRGWGSGEGEMLFNDYIVSVLQDEKGC